MSIGRGWGCKGAMLDVCFQKAALLVWIGVFGGVKGVGILGIVVVVTPFCLKALSWELRMSVIGTDIQSDSQILGPGHWLTHIRNQ